MIYSKSKIYLQNNTACVSSASEDDDAEIDELVRATDVNYQRKIYTPTLTLKLNHKIDERNDFIYIKECVTVNRRIHIFEKYSTRKM